MTTEAWLLLSLTLLAGAASPGPSLALVVHTTLSHGRLAGLNIALAHGFGVGLYALLIVLGLGEVLSRTSWVMGMLQFGGVIFLIYLSFLMIRGGFTELGKGNDKIGAFSPHPSAQLSSQWSYLRDGFLIVFLNPKVLIFFLAIFSQFLESAQTISTQLAAAGLAAGIDGLWYALVAMLMSVPGMTSAGAKFSGYLNLVFGMFLGGVAAWLAFSMI